MSNPETDALREAIDSGGAVEAEMTSLAAKLERERDEWKAKFIQANKDYGFELRDPCGTIWTHANKLQQERDEAREVAENLVEYAHECLVRLESWGKGYDRYEREMETIREAIAGCQKWKEAAR